MDISAALAAHFALLSQALEDPTIDLETGLRGFAVSVKAAVSSYTGLTMTIALDDYDISFTVHEDTAARPATSLLIPLAALTRIAPVHAAGTLLLYAATPGAFIDLAADLSHALRIEPAALVLDGHLDPPAGSVAVDGLEHHVALNEAIGILIGRGHTPESASNELQRLASLDHGDLHAAVHALLREARSRPPTEPEQ